MLSSAMLVSKVSKSEYLKSLNEVDAYINTQRLLLRLATDKKVISRKKFQVAIEYNYEIGMIIGGLLKCQRR